MPSLNDLLALGGRQAGNSVQANIFEAPALQRSDLVNPAINHPQISFHDEFTPQYCWAILVGGLEHVLFFHILGNLGMIIPTD